MVISPTASWIRWCMQVYASELMWTCLVWVERSIADNFWVPSQRFSSATGEQKGITQTIYTDSEPPSRMPNSLMPSAKLRSANFHFLCLWCDAVGDRTPASCTPSGRSTMLRGGGLTVWSITVIISIMIAEMCDLERSYSKSLMHSICCSVVLSHSLSQNTVYF